MSMRCAGGVSLRNRWTLMLLAVIVGQARVDARADDAEAGIAAHLKAGEFGPARAIAERAANRDELLGRIAEFQAGKGMRRASARTALAIADDRSRGSAMSSLGTPSTTPSGGARGGAAAADFDSLIELIQSTIAPDTWEDAGGVGTIEEYRGGVLVDSTGLLKRLKFDESNLVLNNIRGLASRRTANDDVRKPSTLRKVSLTRLEKFVQSRWATGENLDEEMRLLGGLYKINYVLVYPESGDIVIAGPAGDWRTDADGRAVHVETGKPMLQLDDLVVLLRNAVEEDGKFGCSITPTKDALAKAKAFQTEHQKPLKSDRERAEWLQGLRESLGKQDITVYGLDPRTRVAQVLVEADYRMKLVGMGLEKGTLGVTSYLDSVKVGKDGKVPPMDVLRWWFTLNYKAVEATKERNAFALQGPGVKVLSENEMVDEQGGRIHTGKSDELNHKFADSFTRQFEALAEKYPIYAELRNIFDLALVAGLIRSEDLGGQVGWHMTHFGDANQFQVALKTAPTQVETVINHRVINGKHVVAGVSGGVTVDTSNLVQRSAIAVDDYGTLKANYAGSQPKDLPRDGWWWD